MCVFVPFPQLEAVKREWHDQHLLQTWPLPTTLPSVVKRIGDTRASVNVLLINFLFRFNSEHRLHQTQLPDNVAKTMMSALSNPAGLLRSLSVGGVNERRRKTEGWEGGNVQLAAVCNDCEQRFCIAFLNLVFM